MSDSTSARVSAARPARLRRLSLAAAGLVLTTLVAGCGGSGGGHDGMNPVGTGSDGAADPSGAFGSDVPSPSPGTGPGATGSGASGTGIGGSGSSSGGKGQPNGAGGAGMSGSHSS